MKEEKLTEAKLLFRDDANLVLFSLLEMNSLTGTEKAELILIIIHLGSV